MLKYYNYDVVFAEVPDEVTLAINITNCPNHCKGCHSPMLWEDIGTELTVERLQDLISLNRGITCIAFMGGDNDVEELNKLALTVRCCSDVPYKVAWYSGRDKISEKLNLSFFDYIKLGPYIEEYGPLNKKTTNQRLYKVDHSNSDELSDITFKFWESIF